MSWQRVIDKYLERYAEPISGRASGVSFGIYDAAVVVPVFSEETEALARLVARIEDGARALLIVVVNAPTNASLHQLESNARFSNFVRRCGRLETVDEHVQWVGSPLGVSGCDLVLLDVTTGPHRLKPKEGVGRARRLGLDFALALHRRGSLLSPWCGSADADVWLPEGYFQALRCRSANGKDERGAASGLLFPYRHRLPGAPRERELMMELEISFRYYVLGLDYAGSPYAYHSLGSALSVHLPHYAGVRGVPNRQAGEDFHLLSKLSKLAPLMRLRGPTIDIESRRSDRVPFGTGPSLVRALGRPGEGLRFYHPRAFELLRLVLEELTRAAVVGPEAQLRESSTLPAWVHARTGRVWHAVEPLLGSCPDAAHRLRRLHERFDALSALQFIHEAHENGLDRVTVEEAFELSPFLPGGLALPEKLEHCVQKEQSLLGPAGLVSA